MKNNNETPNGVNPKRTELEKLAEQMMVRRVKRSTGNPGSWKRYAQDSFMAAQAFLEVRAERRNEGGAQ